MSILLSDFDYAPFNQIKNTDYLTSIRQGIKELKFEIDTISNNKRPTFKNTIEALDYSGLKLDRISSIFFNINAAETSKEIQDIAVTISPELSELKNYILLNDKLYENVKSIYDLTDKNSLSSEENTLLKNTYRSLQPHWLQQPLQPYFLKKLPDPDGLMINGNKITNTGPFFFWNGSSKPTFLLIYAMVCTFSVEGC